MLVMLAGILLLLSKGSWQVLMTFSFTRGDWWVLAAAFAFAVYNVMAKQRPPGMTSSSFLLTIFLAGTLILGPFYYFEYRQEGGIQFNLSNLSVILYLGLGASVICFLLWNRSIHILGAGRTSLFGNLIPVFSSIGAVLILNEKITLFHYLSFILVVSGLVLANLKTKFKPL